MAIFIRIQSEEQFDVLMRHMDEKGWRVNKKRPTEVIYVKTIRYVHYAQYGEVRVELRESEYKQSISFGTFSELTGVKLNFPNFVLTRNESVGEDEVWVNFNEEQVETIYRNFSFEEVEAMWKQVEWYREQMA